MASDVAPPSSSPSTWTGDQHSASNQPGRQRPCGQSSPRSEQAGVRSSRAGAPPGPRPRTARGRRYRTYVRYARYFSDGPSPLSGGVVPTRRKMTGPASRAFAFCRDSPPERMERFEPRLQQHDSAAYLGRFLDDEIARPDRGLTHRTTGMVAVHLLLCDLCAPIHELTSGWPITHHRRGRNSQSRTSDSVVCSEEIETT